MSDISRKTIVTKLICIDCGRVLNTSYKLPQGKGSTHCDDDPTGTAMLENKIAVYPCECTKAASRELASLRDILKIKE